MPAFILARLRFWPLLGLACIVSACAPPKKPATPFDAAMQHRAHGEMTEYRRSLERELTIHPANLDARYNLAILLADTGHAGDARKLYEANLRRSRHLPSAINLAMLLQQEGNDTKAEQLLLRTSEQFPHEATPWYLLANLAERQGRHDEAERRFREAVSRDRHNGFAHLYYARFLAKQRRFDAAQNEARQSVTLLPDCAPCWRSLGDVLILSGEQKEALTAYQRSLAIQPDIATRQKLIDNLQALGWHDRARRMQQALDAWRRQHPDK